MDAILAHLPASSLGWAPLHALLAACLTLLVAGFVRGFSGFGAGMISVPFLSAIYGPQVAVPTMLGLDLIISIPLLPGALRAASWRDVWALSLSACAMTPVGAWLLGYVEGPNLRIFISVAILISVVAIGVGVKRSGPITNLGSGIAGAASGVLAALSAMSGPPVVLYYLSGPEPAAKTRGALILAFLIINLAATAAIVLSGGGEGAGALIPALMVVFVGGGLIGQGIFAGASEGGYRWVALGLIAASALGALTL